ncbi:MAG TPA: MFS transporter, partial [Pyrinomonadaceae bacterium]|nr:MFS transporter [Pyrinomonadaceae bacterium]
VSRAVGPAIAGLIVAAAGSAAVFGLNAVSFLGVILVIYRWHRTAEKRTTPSEHVWGAMRAGIRYVRHAPDVQAMLVRTAVFTFCASALWAMLPLQSRLTLGLGSLGYGVLLGCLGTGALVGAAILSRARAVMSNDVLVLGGSALFAVATFVLAQSRMVSITATAMLFGGVGWIACMSSLNTAAQAVAPAWARGRVLALFSLVLLGGLAVGSAAWGVVASRLNIRYALDIAASGLLIGLVVRFRYRLVGSKDLVLTPWVHWPEPVSIVEPEPDRGPVLVVIEYHIDPNRAKDFRHAMREIRRIRRRDGAFRWGLYSDPATPGRFVETYLVESWGEHLRQHTRITEADRKIEERVVACQMDQALPPAEHLISERVR